MGLKPRSTVVDKKNFGPRPVAEDNLSKTLAIREKKDWEIVIECKKVVEYARVKISVWNGIDSVFYEGTLCSDPYSKIGGVIVCFGQWYLRFKSSYFCITLPGNIKE